MYMQQNIIHPMGAQAPAGWMFCINRPDLIQGRLRLGPERSVHQRRGKEGRGQWDE